MTLYNTNFEGILKKAHFAAKQAVEAEGPENPNAFDCGYAWATVEGNTPLARYCRRRAGAPYVDRPDEHGRDQHERRRYYGHKGYPRGWQWWNPGQFDGQAIGHKEAGAKAFRDAMASYGIVVTVGSRLD